ncbi:MAG: redoxin domain-containing protein [Pirellulaceae bacterium]
MFRASRYLALAAILMVPRFNVLANEFASVFETTTLDDNYGKSTALSSFGEKQVVVLAFIGTECPLAKLYGPKLSRLQKEFKDQGVQIVGVSSNKQDSLTELTAYVHRYEISFPILKDVGNKLADQVDATRTPEVYVFDKSRKLRYQGRIDDQYGVGYSREKTEESDLRDAILQILAGKEVATPKTKAIGCIIGRIKKSEPTGNITFSRDVAPIFNARCVECHRSGEIGPFTLTSYEDVQGWEDTILEVIDDQRMPPWNANPKYGHFANDARLSEKEIQTLRKWVANGMPEGDPADLPAPPVFEDGWKIPEPDEVFTMDDKPFDVPEGGVVDYQRFVVDPGWDEDKYIYAAEARPQNREVVHHILVYIIPKGARRLNLKEVLVGYAPGSLPIHYKDGLAIKIPAGSKFVFEMHYTPNGTAQTDLSYAGVCFADEADVNRVVRGEIAIEPELKIPPNESSHVEKAGHRMRSDGLLISMTPHMHLRGKAFQYEAFYPDGSSEILLDVPRYDFNWQLKYILQEPKLMPRGTRIVCTATYDNSEDNMVNPNPKKWVRWGDQSYDEMMIGFMDFVPPGE